MAQPLMWAYTVEKLQRKLASMKSEQAHFELCPKEKAPWKVYTKVSFHDPLEDCLKKGNASYSTLEDQKSCMLRCAKEDKLSISSLTLAFKAKNGGATVSGPS